MSKVEEKRNHPRVELMAQVQVSRETEVHIFAARDISKGGVFVHADVKAHADLAVGKQVEIMLFLADHVDEGDADGDFSCQAKIVRVEPGLPPSRPAGFGLMFTPLDKKNVGKLEALIRNARGRV